MEKDELLAIIGIQEQIIDEQKKINNDLREMVDTVCDVIKGQAIKDEIFRMTL